MSHHYPDRWVVVLFGVPRADNTIEYTVKVLAGWYGGYTTGDSWRLNSGVVRVERTEDAVVFYGTSGSAYHCRFGSEGTTSSTGGILHGWLEQAKDPARNKSNISVEVIPHTDVEKYL